MTDFANPLVTIAVLVYNSGKYVTRGLNSVIAQNFPISNTEIIIVDDSSTDDSVIHIENWMNQNPLKNIKFIVHEKNLGLCGSLNDCLSLARGKYFTILADDLWKTNRLDDLTSWFESATEDTVLLHSNFDICDENDNVIQQNFNVRKEKKSQDEFINFLTTGLDIHAVTTMYKTEILKQIGGFDPRLSFEDIDVYLRFLINGYKFEKVDLPLVIYRKSSKVPSISTTHRKNYEIALDFIKMNGNHYSSDSDRNKINFAVFLDALYVYNLSHDLKPTNKFQKKANTVWTPFILKLLREKKMLFTYCHFLCILYICKKYNSYSLRDILFLFKAYFNRNFEFL